METFPDKLCEKLWTIAHQHIKLLQEKNCFQLLPRLLIRLEEISDNEDEKQQIETQIHEVCIALNDYIKYIKY